MAANTSPIFPAAPYIGRATFTSATALTTRTNITGTTGLTQLTATSTNGLRVDAIQVKAKATSVASNVFVWLYDGTTSMLFDEIDVSAVTPGTTTDSASVTKTYNNLVLPPTWQLFVSETVQTDLTVHALGGTY